MNLHIVLYEPEIPQNTGNIIRIAANTGTTLHLIHPLGFEMDASKLKRAGLDYRNLTNVKEHDSLDAFVESVRPNRLLAFSTRGQSRHTDICYEDGDALLYGPETRGLPQALLDELPSEQTLRIPLMPDNRSLNLANSVAIAVYEAWRQRDFVGGA